MEGYSLFSSAPQTFPPAINHEQFYDNNLEEAKHDTNVNHSKKGSYDIDEEIRIVSKLEDDTVSLIHAGTDSQNLHLMPLPISPTSSLSLSSASSSSSSPSSSSSYPNSSTQYPSASPTRAYLNGRLLVKPIPTRILPSTTNSQEEKEFYAVLDSAQHSNSNNQNHYQNNSNSSYNVKNSVNNNNFNLIPISNSNTSSATSSLPNSSPVMFGNSLNVNDDTHPIAEEGEDDNNESEEGGTRSSDASSLSSSGGLTNKGYISLSNQSLNALYGQEDQQSQRYNPSINQIPLHSNNGIINSLDPNERVLMFLPPLPTQPRASTYNDSTTTRYSRNTSLHYHSPNPSLLSLNSINRPVQQNNKNQFTFSNNQNQHSLSATNSPRHSHNSTGQSRNVQHNLLLQSSLTSNNSPTHSMSIMNIPTYNHNNLRVQPSSLTSGVMRKAQSATSFSQPNNQIQTYSAPPPSYHSVPVTPHPSQQIPSQSPTHNAPPSLTHSHSPTDTSSIHSYHIHLLTEKLREMQRELSRLNRSIREREMDGGVSSTIYLRWSRRCVVWMNIILGCWMFISRFGLVMRRRRMVEGRIGKMVVSSILPTIDTHSTQSLSTLHISGINNNASDSIISSTSVSLSSLLVSALVDGFQSSFFFIFASFLHLRPQSWKRNSGFLLSTTYSLYLLYMGWRKGSISKSLELSDNADLRWNGPDTLNILNVVCNCFHLASRYYYLHGLLGWQGMNLL